MRSPRKAKLKKEMQMKSIIVLVSVTSFLFSVRVLAYNEADNFAGIKFGEDLTKQLPECKGPMRVQGKRCYQIGRLPADIPERDLSQLGNYQLYNMGEIQNSVTAIIADQSQDQRLVKITMVFDPANAQRVLATLMYRYGPESTSGTEPDKTGRKLDNTIVYWKGMIVSIIFESRVPAIQRGMVTWKWDRQQSEKAERQRREAETIKKGAKGL